MARQGVVSVSISAYRSSRSAVRADTRCYAKDRNRHAFGDVDRVRACQFPATNNLRSSLPAVVFPLLADVIAVVRHLLIHPPTQWFHIVRGAHVSRIVSGSDSAPQWETSSCATCCRYRQPTILAQDSGESSWA